MNTQTSASFARPLFFGLVIFTLIHTLAAAPAWGNALRILTINMWSGLDYKGLLKSGEYETGNEREARFQSLVDQIKELSPDIVFVQEANPVDRCAGRLASALGMDEVHQVVNAGIKIGSVGIPSNLKEGMVTLVRRELSLKKSDSWKLSDNWGIHSDLLSFHYTEAVIILVATIKAGQQDITLVNVHLAASPRMPNDLDSFRMKILGEDAMSDDQFDKVLRKWKQHERKRYGEMIKLLGHLQELPPGSAVIVAGDFNDGPESHMIRTFREKGKFKDVLSALPEGGACTWDPEGNTNIDFTTSRTDARGRPRKGYELVAALANGRCVRLDYIFLSDAFPGNNVGGGRIVITKETGGRMASDHYGVFTEIEMDDGR